jgi:hypothetical protein
MFSGSEKTPLPSSSRSQSAAESLSRISDSSVGRQASRPLQLQPAGLEEEEKHPAQLKTPENQTGMPDSLKSGVESLSGFDLSDVKVHYNSSQPAQLNALAYAQGSDIHVAPGQERHLPHEAWHVVQQRQGRVQPTMQLRDSVPVNDDPGLEKEADVMGAKAMG